MNIKKFINEGIGERTLYHYTKYSHLTNMLRTGLIRAMKYPGTPEGTVQIATVRPSMVNDKNIQQLSSGSIGGVRLVFDGAVLSDSIRGIKIVTIAELPAYHYQELLDLTKFKESKLDSIIQELEDNDYEDVLFKYKLSKKKIKEFIDIYKEYKKYIINREGEERITIKSDKDMDFLDLNPKYVKIELLKPFPSKTIVDFKPELIKLIKENKKLFIENDIYKDLIGEK